MPTDSLEVVVVIMEVDMKVDEEADNGMDKELDMNMGEEMDTYLTYLVIIAKEVKIVKEVLSCGNVSVPKH